MLETWLVRTLGYPWAEVHAEADKLEHAIPGARVKAIAVSPYDQVMRLQVLGRKEAVVLGSAITGRVFVEISA